MKRLQLLFFALILSSWLMAKEYHVAKSGNDASKGTIDAPLLTIQAAAELAQAGDVITVHEGIYREEIVPPRGGKSTTNPIVYQAALGEHVSIRGSEIIKNWVKQEEHVWMAKLDNALFGNYNPYDIELSGSWLSYGKDHHVGEVYLDGKAFHEKFSPEDTRNLPNTWYAEVGKHKTKIWANFGWANPNKNLVEINVRECVFFPEKQGLRHIVFDGFEIKHAASNWAPPDRFQKGAIGTRFGYGWVIKNCRISDVRCVAICIGAVEDYFWDNTNLPDMDSFGHHLISNNTITRCGQGGIVGCYGSVGSIIENNFISETNYKNEFGGAETAAIKLHFPIDVIIRDNYCKGVAGLKHRTKGIWLDWGVQNTRVSGNIITDFQADGFKVEVGHGPTIIDNNLFINSEIAQWGDAGIYVHNLFYECLFSFYSDDRMVPYYEPHSTKEAGRGKTLNNYDQFINNIFIGFGLDGMPGKKIGSNINHNVYLDGAEKNTSQDKESIIDEILTDFNFQKGSNPQIISFNPGEKLFKKVYPLISADFIGELPVPKMGMENQDGTALNIISDYNGTPMNKEKVMPGPFQNIKNNKNQFIVWPKN